MTDDFVSASSKLVGVAARVRTSGHPIASATLLAALNAPDGPGRLLREATAKLRELAKSPSPWRCTARELALIEQPLRPTRDLLATMGPSLGDLLRADFVPTPSHKSGAAQTGA